MHCRYFGCCLQARSEHLQQHKQQPPYPPQLLGMSPLPVSRSPSQLAAPPPEDAPASSQEQLTAAVGSAQEAAQGAAQSPEKCHAHHSLPGSALASTQQPSTASADSTQEAVQGTGQRALGSSSSAAGASHARAVQQKSGATAVEARPAGGAQLSGCGTTETERLANAGESGNSRQTNAAQAQVDDNPAGMGTAAPGQQQKGNSAGVETTTPRQQQTKDHGHQGVGAQIGSPCEGCSSPQPPDDSRADAWRPMAEGPLQSITEVACMHLLPDFLQDIGQVAITAVLLCLLHRDILFGGSELNPALSFQLSS